MVSCAAVELTMFLVQILDSVSLVLVGLHMAVYVDWDEGAGRLSCCVDFDASAVAVREMDVAGDAYAMVASDETNSMYS
jgi:hypothetical protein